MDQPNNSVGDFLTNMTQQIWKGVAVPVLTGVSIVASWIYEELLDFANDFVDK